MNPLLILKDLNNCFAYSPLKTKIELYILPICISLLIFNFIPKEELSSENKNEYSFKSIPSMLEISKQIENLSKESNFYITNINQYEKIIHIRGNCEKIENIKRFIKNIEFMNSFSNILNLRITKNQNYILEISISFEKYFIKKVELEKRKEEKKELFLNKQEKKTETKSKNKNSFTLNAIVFEYAFINNQWIKIHNKIDNYDLIIVKRNFVILDNGIEKIKVEMKNDKSIK